MVNSKIMVVAVAVLFAVVVFIFCLHIYAKWFWHHQDAGALRLGGEDLLVGGASTLLLMMTSSSRTGLSSSSRASV